LISCGNYLRNRWTVQQVSDISAAGKAGVKDRAMAEKDIWVLKDIALDD
jgi:hypothetical protein